MGPVLSEDLPGPPGRPGRAGSVLPWLALRCG